LGTDWEQFKKLVSTTTGFFLQLVDAEYGWKNINLGWVSGVLMKSGFSVLEAAHGIAKEFSYKKCSPADETAVFTVEEVGDDRMIGPWMRQGGHDDKPRYRSLSSNRKKTLLEWSRSSKSWSMWFKDTSFGRGWWFGWIGLGWRELYQSKLDTPEFPTKGWRRLEGKAPVPQVVSALDGGADAS